MLIRGLVLAGGRSSRFGSDKSAALYRGVPLVGRAVLSLERLGLSVVVSLAKEAAPVAGGRVHIVRDHLPDLGPLGGLSAAMEAYPGHWFLVLTCDMPCLTAEHLRPLLAHARPQMDAVVYRDQERFLPFPGLYSPGLGEKVRERLRSGDLSMRGLLARLSRLSSIGWDGDPTALVNVNRPADLASLSQA